MLDLGTLYGRLALDTSGWEANARKASSSLDGLVSTLKTMAGVATAGVAAAGASLAAFGAGLNSVMSAGSQMESFESRLTTMMGSADAAHARLEELVQFAASTPFDIPGIVNAEVTLQGFGADAEGLMKGLIDFAAGSGATLEQSAIDVAKAWNQGATGLESDTAKILRAGVEARLGVDATKVSIKKFREALKEELDMGKFAGGAMRLASTWEGIVSNMEDNWGTFKRQIADAGVFNNVKLFFASMLNLLNDNQAAVSQLAKLVSGALWSGFKLVATGVAEAVDFTEAWAWAITKAGEMIVRVGAAELDVLLRVVNAAAIAAETLGADDVANKLDAVGDRLFSAATATDAMAASMRDWAAGIDITNDKLGTTTALLAAAETSALLTSRAGGGTGKAAQAAAGGAGKAVEAFFDAMDAWIDQISANLSTVKDEMAPTIDALADLQHAAEALADFWRGMAKDAVGLLGNTGGVISAAAEGAASGGVAGGIAAGAMEALGSSEALKAMQDKLDATLSEVLTALDPIFSSALLVLVPALQIVGTILNSLKPLFEFVANVLSGLAPIIVILGVFFEIIGVVFAALQMILEPLMPILDVAFRVLFTVLKFLAEIILYVMYGIQLAWNTILHGIEAFISAISKAFGGIKALDKLVSKLEGMEADTDATKDSLNNLKDMTYDSAMQTAKAAAATEDMADAADAATEALTNIPSGYKVALARFEATAASTSGLDSALSSIYDALAGLTTGGTTGGSRSGGGGTTGGSRSGTGGSSLVGMPSGAAGGPHYRRGRGSGGGSSGGVHVTIGRAELSAATVSDLALSAEKVATKRRKLLSGLPIGTAGRWLDKGP